MNRFVTTFFAIGMVVVLLGTPAVAQSPRYSSDYGKAETGIEKLVEELQRLIDEADRASAADPLFLRDLRA
ncbi:MAG: hypothetical protein O3A21_05930, partial [Proteobacteria bacterium]|nr:hypothetical protein [Pseudomonadota bacterium]